MQYLLERIDRLEKREMTAISVLNATWQHYRNLTQRALKIYINSISCKRKEKAYDIYLKLNRYLDILYRLEITIIDEQQQISGVGPVR